MEMKNPRRMPAVLLGPKTVLALALFQAALASPGQALAQATQVEQPCDDAAFPQTLCSFVPHDIDRKYKDGAALKVECTRACETPREPWASCLVRAECTQAGLAATANVCVTSLQDKDLEVLDRTQRLYDTFSWKSFIAINWMVDEKGNPKPVLEARDLPPPAMVGMPRWTPRWLKWSTSQDLFPDPAGQEIEFLTTTPDPQDSAIGPLRHLSFALLRAEGPLLDLASQSAPLVHLMNGCGAAMVAPLWDQNGHMVYYQSRVNDVSSQFIEHGKANTLDGQIEIQNSFVFSFPTGVYYINGNEKSLDPKDEGAIEIKMAWKVIDESKGDIPERFFTMATELPWTGGRRERKLLGLVGMHIAHKSQTSAQWIWSTFEHVDNVSVDPAEVARYRKQGKRLRPSFNDPNCNDCQTNQPPCGQDQETPGDAPAGGRTCKTQVTRVLPIARSTAELNAQARQAFKDKGMVWQYYELVGTQWALQPTLSDSNGVPTPRYLSNTMFETYKQNTSCIDCHSHAIMAASKDKQRNTYKTAPSDFSWLLTRAR
ncbi:hypothetical protein [Archangium sp.]|uniref:hypothetical protein n=1 Tax=Archangium sp. TaxID=1872627 RepID=UPI00389AFCF4